MKFRNLGISLFVCCILWLPVVSFSAENDQKSPDAFFPEVRYEFASVAEGKEVTHDFIVQNKGTAPLLIEKVRTG